MNYKEWQAQLGAYITAHPELSSGRENTAMPWDIVSGGPGTQNSAEGPDMQYAGWRATLTPEQLQEYDAAVDQNYAKGEKQHRMMMAAAMAGMGGLAALGAGAGGGGGLMGATDAMLAAPYAPHGLMGATNAMLATPYSATGGGLMGSTNAMLASPYSAGGSGLMESTNAMLASPYGGAAPATGAPVGGGGGAPNAYGPGSGWGKDTLGNMGATNDTAPGMTDILRGLIGGGAGGSPNWLNLAGNALGGVMGSRAAGKAADTQLQYGREANELAKYIYDQNRADLAPYREAGTGALAGIQALLRDPSSVAALPDYQFGMDQGTKALNNGAAARGMTFSGQQAKALTKYGNDYAGTKLNDSYNRLASIAGIGHQANTVGTAAGQNYANNVGNTLQGMGNAAGSGYVGQSNAWSNAIGNALSGWQFDNMLNRLKPVGG